MPSPEQTSLPNDLQHSLQSLRSRVRRYVFLEGACLVVVVVGCAFWLSFLADVAYFRVSRLELPGWFRSTVFVLMLCLVVFAVLAMVILRMLRRLRHRDLALLLEKRFPELDDRVISAVELAEEASAARTPLSRALVKRTVQDADEAVRKLDLAEVFNSKPLRHATLAAAVLATSVVGLSVANGAAVRRWYSAYVRGDDNYWDEFRRSALLVRVLAQPGDRLKDFDEHHSYKHPRGADLTLRVEVAEGKEVPEYVVLEYRTAGPRGTSRNRVTMSRQGDRNFRHTLSQVIEPHELWVVGGDYTNRVPYHVEIVDSPRIDRIDLECDYPDYTGMDAFADQRVRVQGSQISLPQETEFLLTASINKPLVGLTLRSPAFDLRIRGPQAAAPGAPEAMITLRNSEDSPGQEDRAVPITAGGTPFLSADGRTVTIPFVVSASAAQTLSDAKGSVALPVPLPADLPLQFDLHDVDDVQSLEPLRLVVSGIVDLPPVVETRLKGIGRSITRLAGIPIEGEIRDDYGVESVHFGYRVDETGEYVPVPLSRSPMRHRQFSLQNDDQSLEQFSVRPLELRVGQNLALTVFAADGDTLNGPHINHGEVYSFTIVSPEDLLSLLYDKELNLRQRFEQIIAEITETRDDLEVHHGLSTTAQSLRTRASGAGLPDEARTQLEEAEASILSCGERRLHTVRKNHAETRAIEQMFGDIRAELVNNRVDTSTMLERIDHGIVTPLHQINEIDYPQIDAAIALFRLSQERGEDPAEQIGAARDAVDGMLLRMNQILREMRRRETYNELVKRLQSILAKEQALRDRTRKERLRSVIESDF